MKKLDENELYRAVYFAVRDLFENSLEEARKAIEKENPNVTKSTILLTIIYEAVKEGTYKAFKEHLLSKKDNI